MSKIDKLSILGVRSFDNARSETIQFYSPLTLIVGYNGSGKTTIIECLKYATTGELPPNSKGGAFIHDPKLCGEKEVLAQVRVSFKSTEGTKMVCTRNLQLTVKKTARSMKTLEGSLLMLRDGDRHVLSSRVAEMDSLMPRYLGVSKAVLDSVIFCHQDESLWPMAEPSALKKRFDEIFEALKYTKAIDNIKIMQKTQRAKLGEYKIQEQNAKTNKDRGDRMEKQAKKLDQEIGELRNESDGLGSKIKDAARKAEQAWAKAETAGMTVGELNGKRIEQRTKEESVQSIRQTLSEMSDSDEELQNMLEQYEERVSVYEDDLQSQKDRYSGLGSEVQDARKRVSAKERECGSYEAQKENYDRQVENREKLIKETARSHSIRGFDLEINDSQVRAFMERITKMARDQNAMFERSRRETQEALQKEQKELSRINEEKSALTSRKESSRQSIADYNRKIGTLQGELNAMSIDEGSKAILESNLRDAETKLENAKSEHTSADWETLTQETETEQRKLDEQKERLDAELLEGTRRAGDSARLDFVQKELKDRQSSLETMQGAYGDKISKLIGQAWTPTDVEASFQRALNESHAYVAEAEKQRDGTTREIEQLDYKLNSCNSDLRAKEQTVKKATEKIRATVDCEPDEYTDLVRELEEEHSVLKTDADSFARLKEYFEQCLKTASEKNACKTCRRAFESQREMEPLIAGMKHEISKLDLSQISTTLLKNEKELEAAKTVSADFDEWERVKLKELPALHQQKQALLDKRDKVNTLLEQQDAEVNERKSAERDVDSMSRTVQNIGRYNSEIVSFEAQIKDLLAKQKSGGLSRGLEQVQGEISKVNEEARTVKARLVKITGDRDRARNQINSLELDYRDIKSKLSTAEYQMKEKKSLDAQIEELKNISTEHREKITSFDSVLHNLATQLSQAQAKYDETARLGADKDRELQTETNKLNSSLSQLKMADQDIQSYLDKGGPEQLSRGRREVESSKDEVSRLEQDQVSIVREVKQLEDQLRNHSETKRSIADNQRYRRDLRQLQKVRAEIAELESHNAEEDKVHFEREGNRWQQERNKLAAEQATLIGQLKSKDETLKQTLADWETDYKDAAKKYKEAHVMVETCKACVEDLGRYGGALDKAIMKYHSLKMEEINRIIEELWRKTYQGTDVDTILIRSESEEQEKRSNKSYNYRVCMVKQDAEMDMRGRCSAGQKVLASIIIRLALAECFGVNCGLIALDEPTTNLDQDNIRALAESLAEIIRVRRAQKNFQLIVITHDEQFLRYMGCSDFADRYYRVGRNERQKSQIERQSIAEVM